jgi:hypothetical protein
MKLTKAPTTSTRKRVVSCGPRVFYFRIYPINGFLSSTGSSKNRSLVVIQNFKPIFDICRVIRPRLRLKRKFSG